MKYMDYWWWKGSPSTVMQPPSAFDVIGQHNRIVGMTFGASLLCFKEGVYFVLVIEG